MAARTSVDAELAAGLDRLAADLDGPLLRPADDGWDTARQAWHLTVDQRPTAVVTALSVRDVATVVLAAAELGLRVAAQSTGHNAAPMGDLAGTILLRTSAMRSVHIDAEACLARVEAGALWMDVTDAAARHGLAALAGSARDVGVAGYTLGGGLSWLGRSHGLAASSVTAMEAVTADGRFRRVHAGQDPDLFWALRGGGGGFGIVTALEFRLYPVTDVYAGVLFFPIERAEEVLHAWRGWLPSVPDEVTSVGRLLRFPPLPELPPALRGQSYVVVEAACQLPPSLAAALLAPLRALGPSLDTFTTRPASELGLLHMDPDGPTPAHGDGMLLRALPPEAVTAFASGADGADALLSLELRHLGGALAPGRRPGGAVDGIDAAFALFAVGITPDAASAQAVRSAVDAVQRRMGPWSTGGAYLNFAERRRSGEELFGARTYQRLRQIKAAYDPADVIRSNHPVEP
ncbi:oxidoreductase [Pseudofrankia asymbiotica]|uniref:Oxidoreductase n=1 Tax=Pseudofrankia asymbiotica TaxID=1834516 RepID=A0A1V2I2Q8_9ACTN|nr:oxidoreductase [Pseudofrankia asymbiotica]